MKLEALRIPAPLRAFDAGGAQVFDIALTGGKVESIAPSADQQHARGTLLSALVEAHAHIDKNYTVQDVGAAQGNLFAAIDRMNRHRDSWTGESLRLRMERALHDAWQCGTRALRTHLDYLRAKAALWDARDRADAAAEAEAQVELQAVLPRLEATLR